VLTTSGGSSNAGLAISWPLRCKFLMNSSESILAMYVLACLVTAWNHRQSAERSAIRLIVGLVLSTLPW
jgi:hypothetical protein